MEVQILKNETPQVYESNKALIDSQIATAKQYPRRIKSVVDNCLAIVSLNEDVAKACTYAVPRGGKRVTGPSITLAKIIMQQYQNFRAEAKVIDEDAKRITCEAIALDLENNVAVKVQVKRLIVGSNGRFNDDMITITGNAGNSIALRNAIFAVIPKAIVDTVYTAALNKITGDITDEVALKARRVKMFEGFRNNYKVTDEEILKAIGKESVDHITKEDIVVLIGVETAIKEGDTTADMVFRPDKVKKENLSANNDGLTQRERRLIEQINNCATPVQLNALGANVKSAAEKKALAAKQESFKTKQ